MRKQAGLSEANYFVSKRGWNHSIADTKLSKDYTLLTIASKKFLIASTNTTNTTFGLD